MRKGSRKKAAHTDDLLSMALVGYESAKETIEQKISEIRKMIGAGSRAVSAAVESVTTSKPKRRTMSAAGRKRIAAAQKKRWALKRKADKVTAKVPKSKRTPKTALAKSAVASS